MTKYFSRVKGRCGVTNFEDDDDQDLRFLIINKLNLNILYYRIKKESKI